MMFKLLKQVGDFMARFIFSVNRKAKKVFLASPTSLSLEEGASGVVTITSKDGSPVTINGVSVEPGLTSSVNGNSVTFTADPVGPAADESVQVEIDVT